MFEEVLSEDDSLELIMPKKKKRKTAKKVVLGCELIDSFAENTELGKLRLAGNISSAPITKTLYKKINSKVKVTKSIKKAQEEEIREKAEENEETANACCIWFFQTKAKARRELNERGLSLGLLPIYYTVP